MPPVEPQAPLLARRIPPDEIAQRRAYVIHARNGGVGVACREEGHLGYHLHRENFAEHFLFVERDWDQGPPYGTAIPLLPIAEEPPHDDAALLRWLTEREVEHRSEIAAAWDVVLGRAPVGDENAEP